MKKLLCLFLAVLLSISVITLYAGASENSIPARKVYTEAEVHAKIAEAFPEYQSQPQNETMVQAEHDSKMILTEYETRSISDTEEVTHLAYSNGLSAYTYQVDWYINSSSSGSGYTTRNTDVYMSVVGYQGMMQIFGFEYTLVQNGYDYISSFGSTRNSWVPTILLSGIARETGSQLAYGTYGGTFESNFTGLYRQISLTIYIGRDSRTYSVS